MFYGEWKQQYIDTERSDISKTNDRRLFDNTYKSEEKYGCDLCQMTEKQLTQTMHNLNLSHSMLKQMVIRAKKYINYCIEQGYAETNYLVNDMTLDELCAHIEISDDLFITWDEVKQIADILPTECNRLTYRAILYAVYWGLDDGDLFNLYYLNTNSIHDGIVSTKYGKNYKVPKNVETILKLCAMQRKVNIGLQEGKERNVDYTPLPWQDDTYIFKRVGYYKTEDEIKMRNRLIKYFQNIGQLTGAEIEYTTVRKSGLFWRFAVECEAEGYDLRADMENQGVVSAKTGENKALLYNRVLNVLQYEYDWRKFSLDYMNWSRFLENDTFKDLSGLHPWEIE